jgi:hypothetical protein
MAAPYIDVTKVAMNGKAMNKAYPDNFHVPSDEEIAAVKVGDYVKLAVGNERFWVKVVKKYADKDMLGRIDNDLVCTAAHGLKCDDLIKFRPRNILSGLSNKE